MEIGYDSRCHDEVCEYLMENIDFNIKYRFDWKDPIFEY